MSEFLNYSNLFRDTEENQLIKKIFGTILQRYDLIGYCLFRKDKIKNFYTDFIIDLMKYRNKHNIIKLDFVEMLMQLKDNPEKLSKVIIMVNRFLITLYTFIWLRYMLI